MKRICYLVLGALLFAACKKDKKEAVPEPMMNNTIYGQWDLLATAQPFSQDTAWKYIKRAEDLTTYVLLQDHRYYSFKHPDTIIEGTFTVVDSAGTKIKKVTLSNLGTPITLYFQLLDPKVLKVDDEAIRNQAAGYVSKRFGRRAPWDCIAVKEY
ncbi:hypothetical protein AAHN97_27265 [Chitinophaga niabensis]|uniref:hypothetical protein n=1 Tax=Chitinophaga niabensis TaxID=536979 RepID=UPI0031B9DC20